MVSFLVVARPSVAEQANNLDGLFQKFGQTSAELRGRLTRIPL